MIYTLYIVFPECPLNRLHPTRGVIISDHMTGNHACTIWFPVRYSYDHLHRVSDVAQRTGFSAGKTYLISCMIKEYN